MSALGNILQQVEFKVKELLEKVTAHEKVQDKRLDDLTARVELLEGRTPDTTAPRTPPAKKAAPSKSARAGAAEAKGVSQP